MIWRSTIKRKGTVKLSDIFNYQKMDTGNS